MGLKLMLKDYLIAIEEHRRECLEDLNILSAIAVQRSFSRIEQRAAERALQVLIGICIGLAKHWLNSLDKNQPLEAYDSFNKLAMLQKISADELKQWRKIIGMRNALVHDYLNIDSELLQQLLAEKRYQFLTDFLEKSRQEIQRK